MGISVKGLENQKKSTFLPAIDIRDGFYFTSSNKAFSIINGQSAEGSVAP